MSEKEVDWQKERDAWIAFFGEIFDKCGGELKVYLKGGSVLGLHVLQDTVDNIGLESLNLHLIKDWDWTIMVPDKDCKDLIMDKIAPKHSIQNEGQTIKVLRFKNSDSTKAARVFIGDEALWEASIKIGPDVYADKSALEIPMTALTVLTTSENIRLTMNLSHLLHTVRHSWEKMEEEEVTRLKELMHKLPVIVPPHTTEGLFHLEDQDVDWGGFVENEFMREMIAKQGDQDRQQFLTSMLVEPDRAVLRLEGKNLPKAAKIAEFYHQHGMESPPYLLQPVVRRYVGVTFSHIQKEIKPELDQLMLNSKNLGRLRELVESLDTKFSGMNLSRIGQMIHDARAVYQRECQEIAKRTIGLYSSMLRFRPDVDAQTKALKSSLKKIKDNNFATFLLLVI